MKKHKVTICTGTTCFVMGGSELLLLEDRLPPELKAITDIDGATCLGLCRQQEDGSVQLDQAPFVRINETVLEQASTEKIIHHLNTLV